MISRTHIPYRMRQVLDHRRSNTSQEVILSTDAERRLSEPMKIQFRLLPISDQRHLLNVYEALIKADADDDTITAGLIHDVGKACAKCTITLVDRALNVVLHSCLPAPYRWFAAKDLVPAPFRGLHRLANHAERGALAAEQAGYNDRVIELVRFHQKGGARNDEQLNLIRSADNASESRY